MCRTQIDASPEYQTNIEMGTVAGPRPSEVRTNGPAHNLVGEGELGVYDANTGYASIGVDPPIEFRNNLWFHRDSLPDPYGAVAWTPPSTQAQASPRQKASP